jgi:hypothetical protein
MVELPCLTATFHAESAIPDHEAYRKVDHSGMYTSGFKPETVQYFSCGSFREDQCVICKAYHWKLERLQADRSQPSNSVAYKLCCQNGRVMRLNPPPCQPIFKTLLTGEGLLGKQRREFKENVRRVNSHLSFASLCSTKEAKVPGRGACCYKVEGQMVRRLSTAQARPGGVPQFSQVYFHDPSDTHPALKQHPNVQDFTPWLTDQLMILYNHLRHENPYAL